MKNLEIFFNLYIPSITDMQRAVLKKCLINLNYSAAFKEEVVKAYLHGEGSYKDIAIKYKIQAATTVLQWVKRYNNHEELKDSRIYLYLYFIALDYPT